MLVLFRSVWWARGLLFWLFYSYSRDSCRICLAKLLTYCCISLAVARVTTPDLLCNLLHQSLFFPEVVGCHQMVEQCEESYGFLPWYGV